MKLKRIISAFLAAALCATLTVPAFATDEDTADAKELKAALTVVKQRIDIPEELSDFNYSVNAKKGAKFYSLNWSNPNGNGSLNVTYCRKVITNYSYYKDDENYYDWNTISFGQLTPSELIKKAKEFIKQINPTVASAIVINDEDIQGSLRGNQTYINISRKKNGVPVGDSWGNITIDKNTGKVYNFYINWTMGLSFDSPDKALSQSAAEDAYVKNMGIEPVYQINYSDYNEETKTYSKDVSIKYVAADTGYLDALTGEKYVPEYTRYYENGMEDGEAEADAAEEAPAAGVTFTPEEQEKIDFDATILQPDDVTKLLQDNKYIKLSSKMTLNGSNLNKDWYEENKYTWNVYYNNGNNAGANATVDANTGKIYSYNSYDYSDKTLTEIDEAKCDALADTIIESFIGKDMFGEYKLVDSSCAADYSTKKNVSKSYSYSRFVNGIKVNGDYSTLELTDKGTLKGFYYNYSDVEFPSTEGMISAAKAKKILFDKYDLDLQYIVNQDSNGKYFSKLLYSMNSWWSIDAMTGEFDWVDTSGENTYSDIAKSKYKDIIEKLADYGVSLTPIDGKFMENEPITNGEFYNLVSNLGYYYEPIIPIYETNEVDGTMISNYDLPITVSDAATQMVTSIYGSDVPGFQGIFKSPFTDVSDDAQFVGYYAVAYAAGIFKNLNGKNPTTLNPDNNLTRGEAINWIYSYITYSPKG